MSQYVGPTKEELIKHLYEKVRDRVYLELLVEIEKNIPNLFVKNAMGLARQVADRAAIIASSEYAAIIERGIDS